MSSKNLLELEKQLKATQNNYHAFYEFAPVGYFDLDGCSRIINVNLTGAQLLGVPRSFLFGKQFSVFVSKNARVMFHTHLQQAFATKIKQCCELELRKKDGSSFYSKLESVATMDSAQSMTCLRLSVININEQRLMEQALQSSEEKFRSIIETTKEWIWAIDLKGRFLYSNSVIMNILGYSSIELLNRNRFMLIHKDDRPLVAKMFPVWVREKRGWSDLTLRWRCKDGTYRRLESNAVPFFNLQGKLLGFRGADRVVTLYKRAKEKIYQPQIALNYASGRNFLGEFASALAHELTQPLTATNNFIGGCIKRLEGSTTAQNVLLLNMLLQAASQVERAGKIIHHMKDFVQRGKLHFERVNINKIIQESIVLIRRKFPYANVKIGFEPRSSHPFILADKIQLEQVMLNLLCNGIEAVISYFTRHPELQIKCADHSRQHICVSVSDNGPGFYADSGDIEKIFEACFTTKSNGLGMGLTICRTIIEAHHGHLTVHKNPSNRGLCFQFILPVKQKNND